MTPTPRTDAAQHEGLLRGNPIPTSVTTADFARQLERELDAAKAMIESLEDALIEIEASLYEDESENAAGDVCWHVARKALKKLNEHNK